MSPRLEPLHPDDPRDRARYVAAFNAAWPSWAMTEVELHHELAVAGPGRWWTLLDDDTDPIGAVAVERMTWNTEDAPPMLFAALMTERAGVDAYALAAEAGARFARELGCDELRIYLPNTDTALTELIAGWDGWSEVEREIVVARDLTAPMDVTRPLPEEIRITTLAAEPALARSMHDCQRVAVLDVPGDEVHTTPSFETWLQERDTPSRRDDAAFLAVETDASGTDRVLGFAELELSDARPTIANHGYTAVHPEARGRGIALAVKLAAMTWARANGYRELRTENEERNAPIRHINRSLGYVPIEDWVHYRGPVAPVLGR